MYVACNVDVDMRNTYSDKPASETKIVTHDCKCLKG